ncbi:hypothetical protein V6N13_060845 [Hibiscus sabdariffa]|uniref:Kinesin motor domain-containing protein n=1 Tax=Hibiscus sabdariffa TaxID=183260 RepID=A0ABR2P6K1_9ROSI
MQQQSNAAATAFYDNAGGGGSLNSDAGDAVMARWLQSAGLQHLASPLVSTGIDQRLLPNILVQGYGAESAEEKQRLFKLMRNLNFNGESGLEPYTPSAQSSGGQATSDGFYSPEFRGDFGAGLLDLHAIDDTELLSENVIQEPFEPSPFMPGVNKASENEFNVTSSWQQKEQSNADASASSFTVNEKEISTRENNVAKIKVVVRKRPLNKKEISRKEDDVVTVNENALTVHEPKLKVDLTAYVEKHEFCFDAVLDEYVTNDEVYRVTVEPIIPIIFQRTKATCFAYGQTGSGKTFTMQPLPLRAAQDLIRFLHQPVYRSQRFKLWLSFFEIYGGKLFDLLSDRKKLCMREDGRQQVCIVGLQEFEVSDVQIVKEYIERGNAARSTGSTGANEESSRSHAILQLAIKKHPEMKESKRNNDGNESKSGKVVGKISFIDLAGSERGADTTDNDRQTRIEGAEINKSLLALKECIRALDNDQIHIPFRGSKLTEVLRDSFVGNSRTVMISCISPNAGSCEHTLNTLRYADRVKSLSKSGNPKKDQAGTSLPPNSKDATSASSPPTTTDVEVVYEQQQEAKFIDTNRRVVEKDVYTVDYDKQPSMISSSYPFNGREESGLSFGSTDRDRFEVNSSYGGSTKRAYSSNFQNSADTEERAQKVSPPLRKLTREEKSDKMVGNLAKKDGGRSDLSSTNSRQANAVNYNNTNNARHRQHDLEPPDENINAILEEEEALIAAHRKEIEDTMEIVREEMKLLAEVDQPGSLIDNYVTQLNFVLSRKAAGLVSLQSRLASACKNLSSFSDTPSSELYKKSVAFEGRVNSIQQNPGRIQGVKNEVDDVCCILESGPWGPAIENALSLHNEKPQPGLVIGVLRKLKDANLAINYFRWTERKTDQAHCPEAYNSLLTVMARNKKFDCLEQVLGEMSVAGFGLSNNACMELVVSCVKSQKLREAFDIIQMMRMFKFRPAFSAYTTLIGALSAVFESDLMLTLFHQMQELGYEVSVHLFTTVIRVFAKEGRVDAALSLLDEMKSNSFEADVVLYNVCIDCFGKAGKVDMAWKFFHEMKAQDLVPDDVTFTSMIGVLCKANRLQEAVELFELMEQDRKVPCAYAYNTMIMGYGSAGKFDEAYSLLERQKAKGSIPSVISYNCILTCLGKKGKVQEALRVFEEMKKDAVPNLPTYNILVDMLCKKGNLEDAWRIRDAMKEAGLYPNVITVNIMIDRLCKAQKLDEAISIFEGMDHKFCCPNEVTFCSLIEGLGKHGRVNDAYRLYEKMLDSGKIPNAVVYTSLIRNFFKCGRKEDGHKIYKEMLRSGCTPDIMLLNTYMDCVFKAGEIDKGRALFEEIKARGFVPDVQSYSILIHCLVKAGFAHETYQLFHAMKEQGCVLDTRAYNTVIDGFCKSGKVNKAYQLLEEMKSKGHQPTVVTYGSVVDGLAKIDRLDEAYMLFEEAKAQGIELNLVIYSSLIDGFGKVGRIDEAYLILEELMQKGLTPNVYTWNCLLDALVKAEEVDEALVCFKSMKELNCVPNHITYSILINGLCRTRKFNKAFVFWQEMEKQQLKPNTITYTTMISGLAKAGNVEEAHGLFRRFKANGGIPDSACYNAIIEGLSNANRAMDAYKLFEETRRKGCNIHTKTCIVLLDALHKAECLEQAAIVGAVLKETAKSQHASKYW